jgi:D-alanine-D-alanine ligase
MARKLRIGILFGGRSGEHEVSLRSAASILDAIDRKKYDVVPIGINKEGRWLHGGDAQNLLGGDTLKQLNATAETGLSIHAAAAGTEVSRLDVVFPVLHGTFGEDGTIQGLFELAGVAYVGSGVLGSSAGMDKDAMKRMFAASGLPMVKHLTLLRSEWRASKKKCITQIEAALKYPLFVKPANLGSSVGISKVHDRSELGPAMDEAANFDRKIVIEEGVGGRGKARLHGKARELEVAVLGNDDPIASVVGEIVPDREFYDYESKYDASSTSEPQIPAKITKAEAKQIREMAIRAFKACDCAGLARVDFLMEPANPSGKPAKIYLNEINTMPGFTSISMYPKLWEASGIGYRELIDRLIALAIERHDERKQTQFSKD